MESKTIFKLKDVVYVTSLGWGIVIDAGCSTPDGWVGIETNSGRIIHVDTYLVSFTEYTLNGFSQERPEELPKKGDIVWVRDDKNEEWKIMHFIGLHPTSSYKYRVSKINSYSNTNDYMHMTTTNPYANEQ